MTSPGSPDPRSMRQARLKLLALFLAPMAVIGAAYLIFYTGVGLPSGTTNRGQLLQPPPQIGELSLRHGDGTAVEEQALRGDWLLIFAGGPSCDQQCSQRLWVTRQVKKALGRDTQKVRRFYLVLGDTTDSELQTLLDKEHGDLSLLFVADSEWQRLLSATNAPPTASRPIYLVDPRGYLMMAYTLEHEGTDTLKDLRFLIKYSPE